MSLRHLSCLASFCAWLLLASCSGRDWRKVSPSDVRQILPAMTMLSVSLEYDNVPDSIRQANYRSLLGEHGYSLTDWDSSMAWYAANEIDLFYDFYRAALDDVTKLQTQLHKRQDSIHTREEFVRNRLGANLDSINLLSLGYEYYHRNQLINRSFSIVPTTPYLNGWIVRLSTNLYTTSAEDSIAYGTLSLQLHLSDSTILAASTPVHSGGAHSVVLSIPQGKQAVRVSGFLRGVTHAERYILCDSLRLVRLQGDPSAENSAAAAITQPAQEAESSPEELVL